MSDQNQEPTMSDQNQEPTMSASDKINAELDKLGIQYDPGAHWKQRQKLLTDAQEQLSDSSSMNASLADSPLPGASAGDVVEVEGEIEVTPNPKATGKWGQLGPPQDPRYGDKTPEVVAWRRDNWSPEKFAKTYEGRTIPK